MEFLIAETVCILLQIICFFPFWRIWREERNMAYGYLWEYADDFCSYGERKDGEG